MKFLVRGILILGVVLLVACSTYQKRFGGKSGDYENAEITAKVQYPVGINALKPSDRYNIPEVKSSSKDYELVDTAPPDYQE